MSPKHQGQQWLWLSPGRIKPNVIIELYEPKGKTRVKGQKGIGSEVRLKISDLRRQEHGVKGDGDLNGRVGRRNPEFLCADGHILAKPAKRTTGGRLQLTAGS